MYELYNQDYTIYIKECNEVIKWFIACTINDAPFLKYSVFNK